MRRTAGGMIRPLALPQLELTFLQGCLDERVHLLVAILADFLVYDRVMQVRLVTPGRTRHFTGQVGTRNDFVRGGRALCNDTHANTTRSGD